MPTRDKTTGKVAVAGTSGGNASFPSLPSAGSLAIVEMAGSDVALDYAAGTVTDNQGNTYTRAVQSAQNNRGRSAIFYCLSIGAPSGTFTVTVNTIAGNWFGEWVATTFTPDGATFALDQTQSSTGTSTTPTTGATATTSVADEVIAAVMQTRAAGTLTITVEALSPAWVQEAEELDGTNSEPGEADTRIVTATAAMTGNWTVSASSTWTACIATFSATPSGGAGTVGILPQMFHPGAGIWNFARFYQTPQSTDIPSAGTVFTQSVDGTLTMTGSLARNVFVFKAGTLSSSGSLVKQTQRALTATMTSAGALAKQARKVVAGTLTSSGALTTAHIFAVTVAGTLASAGALLKRTNKTLSGTLTSAGALVRQAQKSIAGTLTSSATVIKQTQKVVAGTLTSSGALAASKVALKSVAGTLTSSGALLKRANKVVSGSLTSAGAVVRQAQKALAGTVRSYGFYFVVGPTTPPDWDAVTTYSAGAIVHGEGANYFTFRSTINEPPPGPPWMDIGSNTTTQELVKQTRKFPVGTLTSSAALSAGKTVLRAIAGSLPSSSLLTKRAGKSLAGSWTATAAVSKRPSRVVVGVLSSAGTITRQIYRQLVGLFSPSGNTAVTNLGPVNDPKVLVIADARLRSAELALILSALSTVDDVALARPGLDVASSDVSTPTDVTLARPGAYDITLLP